MPGGEAGRLRLREADLDHYLELARPFWPAMPAEVNVIQVPYFPWLVSVRPEMPRLRAGVNTEPPVSRQRYEEWLTGRLFANADDARTPEYFWLDYGPFTNTLCVCLERWCQRA